MHMCRVAGSAKQMERVSPGTETGCKRNPRYNEQQHDVVYAMQCVI